MQEKSSRKAIRHELTKTPGIYKRCDRFSVKWREEGKVLWRSFPTYEAACAFKRDYVIPYRERKALPPTTLMPAKRSLGWVYFFQAATDEGAVKIGWSSDPRRRHGGMASSVPFNLELVALIPGTKALEKRLHQRFDHFRIRGEWFGREVLDGLTELVAGELAKV
jgi:hypothetical protein